MTEIDLLPKTSKTVDFTPIEISEDADLNTLHDMLNGAHEAHDKYKKMLEHVRQADAITDGLTGWTSDYMTEECETPTYEDSALDVISGVKDHLIVQVARFAKLQDDLEGEIYDAVQCGKDDAEYGTYEEQVASTYWGSR